MAQEYVIFRILDSYVSFINVTVTSIGFCTLWNTSFLRLLLGHAHLMAWQQHQTSKQRIIQTSVLFMTSQQL